MEDISSHNSHQVKDCLKLASDSSEEGTNMETGISNSDDNLNINIGGPGPGQMSREDIEESLSQIIDGIKDKRKQDTKVVEDVCKEIMAQAKRSCEMLEQHMVQMHTIKNKEMDEGLKQVFDVLDKIKQAEAELETSKTSLHALCQEIQKSLV